MGNEVLDTSAKARQVVTAVPQQSAAQSSPLRDPHGAAHPGGEEKLSVAGSAWRGYHAVSPDRRTHNPGTRLVTWSVALSRVNLDNISVDGFVCTTLALHPGDSHLLHWTASCGAVKLWEGHVKWSACSGARCIFSLFLV